MASTHWHTGDAGDLIYWLSFLKHNPGKLTVSPYLGGQREIFNKVWYDFSFDLLVAQPYVSRVFHGRYNPQEGDYSSVDVRRHSIQAIYHNAIPGLNARQTSLHDWPFLLYDRPIPSPAESWIAVPPLENLLEGHVVFARSRFKERQNPVFPWKAIRDLLWKKAVFVGSMDQYHEFIQEVGYVQYYRTNNSLDIANCLAKCQCLFSNATLVGAIGEGMKRIMGIEEELGFQGSRFDRPGLVWEPNKVLAMATMFAGS